MIPSDFIRGCLHQYVNVCLKNGDLYNGILDECDNMNNFVLLEVNVVTRTRKEFSLERAMIRGGSIKLICLPNHVIDLVKTKRAEAQRGGQNQTGGYGQQNNKWQKDKQNFNKDHQNNNNNYNNNNNNYNNRNRGGRGGYRGGRGGARGRGGYNNYNNNYNNHNNYNNNNNDNGFVYTPS